MPPVHIDRSTFTSTDAGLSRPLHTVLPPSRSSESPSVHSSTCPILPEPTHRLQPAQTVHDYGCLVAEDKHTKTLEFAMAITTFHVPLGVIMSDLHANNAPRAASIYCSIVGIPVPSPSRHCHKDLSKSQCAEAPIGNIHRGHGDHMNLNIRYCALELASRP
ncbi:uncharacterized protein CLUP02_03675 [Colletotrichum lupini]|uniref:Uncharacterized protein n=1 Tax=Colletotrichum lupini TaxID=145971 RepID=A0A9Q8SIV5_9PEZI|nr:uncharacterized protein CLUP02_03675 [Colletotrichum lupini]UQC78199.1 hypothetical protein CLUP02_03675 [Colletotrichum lupini]